MMALPIHTVPSIRRSYIAIPPKIANSRLYWTHLERSDYSLEMFFKKRLLENVRRHIACDFVPLIVEAGLRFCTAYIA